MDLPVWKLESKYIKVFLDLAAKLAENPDTFLLIGQQFADSTGSWYGIRYQAGETSDQRKARVIHLLRSGKNKTLQQLHDILLPVDKTLAEYVANIKL